MKNELDKHDPVIESENISEDQLNLEQMMSDEIPGLSLISKHIQGFMFNQGFVTCIESVDTKLDTPSGKVSFASQLKVGINSECYICLCLDETIATNIAASHKNSVNEILKSDQNYELFCQIMSCLGHKITGELLKLGYQVKQGASQAFLPPYQQCVALKCRTILGPFDIAIVA